MKKMFFLPPAAILAAAFFLPLISFGQSPNGNMIGINVGNVAPDVVMKNPNDSTIALSSLRGKVVLLDFWASWCGPCRGENPNVVKTYLGYKDSIYTTGNGFTVFSVSLDKAKDAWKAAIDHDGLVWPYHVSDLQYWNNAAAQQYEVYSIPTNFLIDGNGVIIAKGLRGDMLPLALSTQVDHTKYKNYGKGKKPKPKKDKNKEFGSGSSFMRDEKLKSIFDSNC